jgi:exodeoxyribonuclease-3
VSDITILSWNVNGLRAAYKRGFIEWLLQKSPDILCIQETKATEEQLPAELKGVTGYYAYFSAAERKGYSGVAIYTKEKPASVEYGFSIEKFDKEGRILIADYSNFILLNIYFPNGKASSERLQYKLKFYDAFLDYVNNVRSAGKHVVVCGDLNTAHKEIDLARPKENENVSGFLPIERAWIDRFLGDGYVDTFRMFNDQPSQYTWWDMKTRARERNVGWRLDYFFVNKEFSDKVKSSYILSDVTGSDHCPIALELLRSKG